MTDLVTGGMTAKKQPIGRMKNTVHTSLFYSEVNFRIEQNKYSINMNSFLALHSNVFFRMKKKGAFTIVETPLTDGS